MNEDGFLPSRGNYRELLSYQKAEVIYDITFRFCKKFLTRGDRTVDQMIQAARSGKQNIAEGSKAALTSTQTEIRLTNVARASLEELLVDYEDFLRVRDLERWDKDLDAALYVRNLSKSSNLNFELFRPFCETRSAEVIANIALCLINQTNYLLDQQIRKLEKEFVRKGGLRERMTAARRQHKKCDSRLRHTSHRSYMSYMSHMSHMSHNSHATHSLTKSASPSISSATLRS